MIIAGLAVITYPLYTFYFTSKAQSGLKEEWKEYQAEFKKESEEKETPEETSAETTEETTPPEVKTKTPTKSKKIVIKPAFRLIISKIKLDMIVIEGSSYAHLRYGPGHMVSSAYSGERGPCVISGHRTTYGAPFYHLDKLKKNDEIILETLEGKKFTYLVKRIASVKPDDLSILKPTVEPTLVLTTCTPIRSASKRLVIFASLVDLSISGGK